MSSVDVLPNGGEIENLEQALLYISALDWRISPSNADAELEGASPYGFYDGLPPKVELLADGRNAHLLAPIAYTDAAALAWPVPAGADLDGASIPRPLWSIIGGPFEGRYRDASIIHDFYCVARSRSWAATHRMFHDAMRCSGVARAKAKIMFYAVYRFGPRWPDPLEAVADDVTTEPLNDVTAPSLAYDAETIVRHDPSLAEIEALADARAPASPRGGSLEAAADTSLARLLSVTGGKGDAADLEAVVARASLLPDYVLSRFRKKGVRFVACRDNVTDFDRSLRDVVPRGWESTGKTWNDVPGAYLPNRNSVVIATTTGTDGARVIPDKNAGTHGSADLLVHESLHGYDFASGHAVLKEPRFVAARTADFARLDAYEQQAGDAGLQETFAESGARYFVAPDDAAPTWPTLFGYWQQGPDNRETVGTLESVADQSGPIGTIEKRSDGTIALDLRAEGEGGAIGHAQFVLAPGDAAHAALDRHFAGPREESAGGGSQDVRLFYP